MRYRSHYRPSAAVAWARSSGSAAAAASPGAKPHRVRQGYADDLVREGIGRAVCGKDGVPRYIQGDKEESICSCDVQGLGWSPREEFWVQQPRTRTLWSAREALRWLI